MGFSYQTKEELKAFIDYENNEKPQEKGACLFGEYNDEMAIEAIAKGKEFREEKLLPYLNMLGNCELVLLPGDHAIYEHRPDEVADIMLDFLEDLNRR